MINTLKEYVVKIINENASEDPATILQYILDNIKKSIPIMENILQRVDDGNEIPEELSNEILFYDRPLIEYLNTIISITQEINNNIHVDSLKDNNNNASPEDKFMNALLQLESENTKNSLLSISDLRNKLPQMTKKEFDNIALKLSKNRIIFLHYHDFPQSLSPQEREKLVVDANGIYYVGIGRKK